jgi:nitroreductase
MDLYFKYAAFGEKSYSIYNLESQIMAVAHSLEKRMSFKNFKVKEYQNFLSRYLRLLQSYQKIKPESNHVFVDSSFVIFENWLTEVRAQTQKQDEAMEILEEIELLISELKLENSTVEGGVRQIQSADIIRDARGDFAKLVNSRFSVRDFSEKKVDPELIMQAVVLAQKSPSVCNRQATKVYLYNDETWLQEILKLQNGNKGFNNKIKTLLIVCSDLRSFYEVGERNQAFIDGGLFAMTLLHALHYYGLAACSLNWSVDYSRDLAIYPLAKIPEHDRINFLIAVGHLPDELLVPISVRKDIEEVLIIQD